ncbi:CRP-like cAMP-binding protein [Saccharothrix ecbatanensis]|uniref:CRP-like cAMP-binding protein n=1 Tax=Saccharothrix ecbatanensis TaxID=1105145 RepID=A0A7W9LZ19_9PSEU|nr:Crp/Fnr family transcriptional regulator [Saccharothrix ecbatanensis]MBB5801253.1 CRP-like cAMP-binding protein [Saccharothrix ecbatanensis]
MARDSVGRRLLAALADSTTAFGPAVVSDSADAGCGRRFLAALTDTTPAFAAGQNPDSYTPGPQTLSPEDIHAVKADRTSTGTAASVIETPSHPTALHHTSERASARNDDAEDARLSSTPARSGYEEPNPPRFWELLDPAGHALLNSVGTVRTFDPGDVVYRQDERSRHVLVIRTGLLRVTTTSSSGHEKVLAVRGPGDILGERSAVDGGPHSATARALGQMSALLIPAERFAELCHRQPPIAWAVLSVLVSRQRDLTRQRTQLSGTATQRVATVLFDLASQRAANSSGVAALSQGELASIAGTSRESLVRVLRSLRKQGIVRTSRHRIDILDPDRLYELIG